IATATATVAPKAATTATMAVTRLLIGRVPDRAEQPAGDHHDDQQGDRVQTDRADVPVRAQLQPRIDDHVDRDHGEEAAEDQPEQEQGGAEVWVQWRWSVDG